LNFLKTVWLISKKINLQIFKKNFFKERKDFDFQIWFSEGQWNGLKQSIFQGFS